MKQLVSREWVPSPKLRIANDAFIEAANIGRKINKLSATNTVLKNKQPHQQAWNRGVRTHFRQFPLPVVPEEHATIFEQGPTALRACHEILVFDASGGISFHIEEVMTQLVLNTVTTQHKRVDKHLSATVNSLIERIVKKLVSSLETISVIWKAVIDNRKFIAPTTALVKSGQRKYTKGRAKIEERCQ